MERTELREQFFAEVRNDPYAHMLFKSYVRAWADGYDQALRDHGLTEARLAKSFSDREHEAAEFLTSAKKKAEAQAIIATAQIGSLLTSASSPAGIPETGNCSDCGRPLTTEEAIRSDACPDCDPASIPGSVVAAAEDGP